MISVQIENADAQIGKGQGYHNLAVRRDNFDGQVGLTSAWEPSIVEIERLAMGAKVHVSFLGETIRPGAQPPMIVTVGDVPG